MKPTGWPHRKRLPNNLDGIISALRSCAGQIQGVAVESTFNWYWLVDGLQEAGYVVHLENTAAVKQYDGLKYSGDAADARHLAHLLRLGILPEGISIRVKARRARSAEKAQPVGQAAHHPDPEHPEPAGPQPESAAPGNLIRAGRRRTSMRWRCCPSRPLCGAGQLAVMHCLDEQIHGLEHAILERATLREDYRALQTVSGIGKVLALTIALETGDIGRFASPGNFASYARTVSSRARVERQEKRRRQHQVRQPAPGLGLRRSGALCGALQRTHQALLPEEERPHAAGGSHQGGGPQAGAGELPRHEER